MDYLNLLVDTNLNCSLLLILDLQKKLIKKNFFNFHYYWKLQLDKDKMNTLLPISKMLSRNTKLE